MIRSLADASTEAKERISAMEKGHFKIVGFIEPDDSDSNRSKEKREGPVGSRRRHD